MHAHITMKKVMSANEEALLASPYYLHIKATVVSGYKI